MPEHLVDKQKYRQCDKMLKRKRAFPYGTDSNYKIVLIGSSVNDFGRWQL